MAQLDDVNRFIEAAQDISNPKDLEQLIADITAEMGFDYYALIHHVDLARMNSRLTHMTEGQLVAITNYPEAWVETYVKRNIVSNDPVLLASQRTNVGFRWEKMGDLIQLTSAHRSITADTRRAGIEEGYTIPANVPGEANGSCNFAMRSGRPLPENALPLAQLVGSFAFQAARSLVLNGRNSPKDDRQNRLTSRQLECVALVGRGKSDWEIGRILGISEETVKHYLKQAREQYDVPKRIQVVMRAVFEGQLAIADVIN